MRRLLLAIALPLSGCLGYKLPAPPTPRDATQVSASVGTSWDAVIDLFALSNIPIRTMERASGFVATEQLSVGLDDRLKWGDCGKLNGERFGPNHGIYNVLVRGDSTRSSVKATVRWIYLTDKPQTIECSTTHVWERGFEGEVRLRAERARTSRASAADDPVMATAPDATAKPAARPAEPSQATAPSAPRRSEQAGTTSADLPTVSSSDARPNNTLLTFEGFRRAIGDMQRKGMLLGYREAALERLEVDLSATAFGEPTLEYQITRLFLAYGATMNDATQPTLVLRANAQQVGLYTRHGLDWDVNSGRH